MNNKVNDLLTKNKILPRNIMYILKEDRRCCLYLENGAVVSSYIPLKDLREALDDHFISINKGVILGKDHIISVKKGVYTMTDGSTHKGRVRTPGVHKTYSREYAIRENDPARDIKADYAPFQHMPLAFCVIEFVFDKKRRTMDFIFRYCNDEMSKLENKPIEAMLDKSYYEVCPDGDKSWLVTCADVSTNGSRFIFREFSPELGKELEIYCFRPAPNLCACVLRPIESGERSMESSRRPV